MNFETRVSFIIQLFFCKFQEKFLFFQNIFSIALFSLFCGFLIANIFGSFLDILRNFITWDGFIVLFLILLIELISSIIYSNKNRSFFLLNFEKRIFNNQQAGFKLLFSWFFKKTSSPINQKNKLKKLKIQQTKNKVSSFSKNNLNQANNLSFWKIINYFKLGIMLGFFIDAFKVGS